MRYFSDGTALPPHIGASSFGVGKTQIPYYLLICASPAEVPWEIQYLLNTRFAVGRLDLDHDGLSNYIRALRCGWSNAKADPFASVVWATDHGGDDMSGVMRRYVAQPIFEELRNDQTLAAKAALIERDAGKATSASLLQALTRNVPGLIVTTSHGMSVFGLVGAVSSAGAARMTGGPAAERPELLARSCLPDAVFVAPPGEVQRDRCDEREYRGVPPRSRLPMSHFGAPDGHGEFARASWVTRWNDGRADLAGEDFARFGADGRISLLVSFDGTAALHGQ